MENNMKKLMIVSKEKEETTENENNEVIIFAPENTDESKSGETLESMPLTPKYCRICYEEASDTDPIILVGCSCKGDTGIGHTSCLKKWYHERLLDSLRITCEVCKGELGETLRSALLARHLPEVRRGMEVIPEELVLIQVPIKELDRLKVPLDTPPVQKLNFHTQDAIRDVLEMEAKKHLKEVNLRESMHKHQTHAVSSHELLMARVRRKEEFLDEYIQLVKVERNNRRAQCAYFPRYGNPSNIRIDMDWEMTKVLRVQATPSQEHAVNALSRELATSFKDFSSEHVVLLPRRMIVDDIYINRTPTHLPPPLSPQKGVASRRQVTYARYQKFNLINDRRYSICTTNRLATL